MAFADHDLEPWPQVEAVLARALEKAPDRRYASVAGLVEALRQSGSTSKQNAGPSVPAVAPGLALLRDRVLERAAVRGQDALPRGGEWLANRQDAPDASITFGAAGVACGLLRMATRRDDAGLLAAADVWAERAARRVGHDQGFYNPDIEISRETVGESSAYHTASGVFAARALVARARGDVLSQAEALDAFLATADAPSAAFDLATGSSATLIAASLLLESLPAGGLLDDAALRETGRRTLEAVWHQLDAMPAIAEAPVEYLGIAHGWAGFIYAALRWHQAAGEPLPEGLPRRLAGLAGLAEPQGRGLVWPLAPPRAGRSWSSMPGWCNGSAGHVLLWTLAHRLLGDSSHLELARGAAWETWDDGGRYASLCCGLAGRAWALLALYRATGERSWLIRAGELARRGASSRQLEEAYPHSLYKGELGLAVLAVDLEYPEEAAMPFFEAES